MAALVPPGLTFAADWPTYQHDAARSAVTAERLAGPLELRWTFQSPSPPARGWPEPEQGPVWEAGIERVSKVSFDDAFHAVSVGDAVYFCSSAENRICCLDAASGKLRWSVHTDGPPRLAPTVADGKVYVGADDGIVRCLDAATGRIVWEFRAAPKSTRALGHGRMMSLWPVRTGVVVMDGVAYFGAGVFPGEGELLYALDAKDGKGLWVNSEYDEAGRGDLSPQGYLLASESRLIMPSARIAPAVFDRKSGKLLFKINGGRALTGGTYCLLDGARLYNGTQVLTAYDLDKTDKDKYGHDLHAPAGLSYFNARRLVVDKGVAYVAAAEQVLAIPQDRLAEAAGKVDQLRQFRWQKRNQLGQYDKAQAELAKLDRNAPGAQKLQADIERLTPIHDSAVAEDKKLDDYLNGACRWRLPVAAWKSLVLAGDVLYAGGEGQVIAIASASGKQTWSARVTGDATGLAVANGRLLVSTTTGAIHCFAPGSGGGMPATAGMPRQGETQPSPYPRDDRAAWCARTAGRILGQLPSRRGYALVLGGGAGQLAYELALQSELNVYVLEGEERKVAQVRESLTRAGMYGARITVDHGPLNALPYPPYFANLIVCEESFGGSIPSTPAAEMLRVLRPVGGVAFIGNPDAAQAPADAKLREYLEGLDAAQVKTALSGGWAQVTRGVLPGAGTWTHQYADAGNTACSEDRLTDAPFGVLWFGDPGARNVVERHAGGPAALSMDGRMFIEGRDRITAYDAYNGLCLWQRELPDVEREHVQFDCGNMALCGQGLLVVVKDQCLRLNVNTGETLKTYALPPRADRKARRWAWIATDGKLLFGSRAETAVFRSWPKVEGNASEAVFAMDLASGELKWLYEGRGIMHPSIAVGDGKVFLVDGQLSDRQRQEAIEHPIPDEEAISAKAATRPAEPDVRLVVALDASGGKKLWDRPVDVTDCVVQPAARGAGGEINLIYKDRVLLLCSGPGNGHFLKEWAAGYFTRRSIIALADDGKVLWSGHKGYRSRPVVMGDMIFAEPWAHDLKTGKQRARDNPITGLAESWIMWRGYGGCGTVAASANTLFFRAGCLGCYDVRADDGIRFFGAQRPSCWINFITANGLVLFPEGSSQCDCAYSNQCTVVLYPRKDAAAWAGYPLGKPLTPVKHLCVNLGAPGDRRDAEGLLWFHCPNREYKYAWLATEVMSKPGAGFYCDQADQTTAPGTDKPWVFTSGCKGVRSFSAPMLDKGQPSAAYTVRLFFAEPDDVKPGDRVFDVSIQGKCLLKDFDVVALTGGRRKPLVKEFKGVQVADQLKIEFSPPSGRDCLPILCGVQAIREP